MPGLLMTSQKQNEESGKEVTTLWVQPYLRFLTICKKIMQKTMQKIMQKIMQYNDPMRVGANPLLCG
jgi:hypothetical protein